MTGTESTDLELYSLYNTRAKAYLNVLYYGSRAATWASWNLWLQIGASVGSLAAVTGFLALGTDPVWKWTAAGVALMSAISAALPPIMGHADKVNRFEKLHFAYCELLALTERTIMDIRRSDVATGEQIGAARMLSDLSSRLGQQDAPDLKDKLRDHCEMAVRKRFPASEWWYHKQRAAEGKPTSAATTTGPAETPVA
jgi:hypothetical protein